VNPYRPGKPADPRDFAGRAELISRVDEELDHVATTRSGHAFLLYGYRGCGKTSALRKIQAQVRGRLGKAIAIEIPLRAPKSSDELLLLSIVEEIQRVAHENASVRRNLREAMERISGLSVGVAGTGVAVSRGLRRNPISPMTVWKQCLGGLTGVPCLCICVDDAELLDMKGLATLKTIAEEDSSVPILLVVAGGIELFEKLTERDSSPVARAFSGSMFDIGEFTPKETEAALVTPIRKGPSSGSWSSEAIATIHRLSHGYPYLVQCLAHAAFRDSTRIEPSEVMRALPAALKTASVWLDRESSRLSDQDIVAFARIAAAGRSPLRASDLAGLGVAPPYVARLVKAGVLQKLARGHYEVRKAPAIAYYHALKRGLELT
jgi:type II secretory pathway predicted ATPase ExeA